MLKIFCGMKGYIFSLSLTGERASLWASLDNLESSSLLEETVNVSLICQGLRDLLNSRDLWFAFSLWSLWEFFS
jgi:hypothetical protein